MQLVLLHGSPGWAELTAAGRRRPLGAESAPLPHGQGWLLLGSLCLSSAGCTDDDDDASFLLYKLLCTDRAVWLC